MSLTVIDHTSSMRDEVGVRFRPFRRGPELELIENFLHGLTFNLPNGFAVTAFREPQLECNIPDIVLVIWDACTTTHWNLQRPNLTTRDLRVAHYVYQAGYCTNARLQELPLPAITGCLNRLHSAGLIKSCGDGWELEPIESIFTVKKIIAIEAKTTYQQAVLNQAHLNTWFASDSCVLVPHLPKSGQFVHDAFARQIAVWFAEPLVIDVDHKASDKLPISYASWLFNEWAWRADMFSQKHPIGVTYAGYFAG